MHLHPVAHTGPPNHPSQHVYSGTALAGMVVLLWVFPLGGIALGAHAVALIWISQKAAAATWISSSTLAYPVLKFFSSSMDPSLHLFTVLFLFEICRCLFVEQLALIGVVSTAVLSAVAVVLAITRMIQPTDWMDCAHPTNCFGTVVNPMLYHWGIIISCVCAPLCLVLLGLAMTVRRLTRMSPVLSALPYQNDAVSAVAACKYEGSVMLPTNTTPYEDLNPDTDEDDDHNDDGTSPPRLQSVAAMSLAMVPPSRPSPWLSGVMLFLLLLFSFVLSCVFSPIWQVGQDGYFASVSPFNQLPDAAPFKINDRFNFKLYADVIIYYTFVGAVFVGGLLAYVCKPFQRYRAGGWFVWFGLVVWTWLFYQTPVDLVVWIGLLRALFLSLSLFSPYTHTCCCCGDVGMFVGLKGF
jgi:hypothetical protein